MTRAATNKIKQGALEPRQEKIKEERTAAGNGGHEAEVVEAGRVAHEHQLQAAIRQMRLGRQAIHAHVTAARGHHRHYALVASLHH